ncbi:synaptopodin-2 isoform X3 [Apodemus sylvaticus]|uniref:synaptopodin-2 isoform X3 n=1 Tax=Apodemus sylvaticus TaxID=10129 RepID=UPI002244046F|nr:synaptopodin-2 isoform X3 [Apodemus sylvaticus]
MGTGDFICISMTGGAPWGFRLQGGKEEKQPLQVAKIRSQSKASGSGLCEGDEVVSINGNPCADLTYPEVIKLMESITDSLHLLVKRPSSGTSETLDSETENTNHQHLTHEGPMESTTLQIHQATKTQSQDFFLAPVQTKLPLTEDQGNAWGYAECTKEEQVPQILSSQEGHLVEEVILRKKAEAGQPGHVVELQLSLSKESRQCTSGPIVTLQGNENFKSPDPDWSSQPERTVHINSISAPEKADTSLTSTTTVQTSSGRELRATQGGDPGGAGLPQVEVILECSDRLRAEECRLQTGRGCVASPVEGGRSEAPPSLVSFAVSSEGTEPGEDQRSGKDHSRPHKHRARHARLRRSESLSEKQVKEAKSKCKSIALLLTDAPNPNSKGVLMFKKRRRRARKYTLVSYGTGELEREEEEEEDQEAADKDEISDSVAFLGTSESEVDEELLSDIDDGTQVVNFDWDSGLVDIEKRLNRGDKMEMLPDTTGKGALMFAKRRERMEQFTAQNEEEKTGEMAGGGPDALQTDGLRTMTSSYQRKEESVRMQSSLSESSFQMGRSLASVPQHNGFSGMSETAGTQRTVPTNRTAKPFLGSMNQPAAAPFSPTRSVTSPISDFPAPPPYSAVSPPPEAFARGISSPVAGPAQPPPWPQPAPWSQPAFYDSSEQIASRDERIAVPAKRTGILQEAKRRGSSKPMFTFKETKVNPNPELLSLLQNAEGKRGTGGDSGPEEDYLSLGAEACNFMQSSAKQKTPPPVAPKPAVRSSSSSQPVAPVSPVWSPGVAPAQRPAFSTSNPPNPPQVTAVSSIKIAQPTVPPGRPASALNLAGPFKGPQATVVSHNYIPKPSAPTPLVNAAPAGAGGPSNELPGMSGKGAQLFAKRQSRMEKYVVDSDTVQAHAARAQSPTPSLPASWKYSSNVRAPPPMAYNPIHSPSYPLAAIKSQPPGAQASKTSKKKGKKPLNTLDVMKHQPYQLNASLFTFQPPDSKDGLPQKSTVKESGRSLSLPGRSAPPTISASPWLYQSACGYSNKPTFELEKANKRPTPWEAAAKSPLGLVDDAFRPRNIQESIVANVVSAARRKVFPGSQEDWKERLSFVPQTQKTSMSFSESQEYNAPSPVNSHVSSHSLYSTQLPYMCYRQESRNDLKAMSMETRSEYGLPLGGYDYNPHPRGWRHRP